MKYKISILLLILAIGLVGCKKGGTKQEQNTNSAKNILSDVVILGQDQIKAVGIEIGSFQMRNLTSTVKTNGQLSIAPQNQAEVSAIIGGNVKEIKVFYGQKVKKGQVLAVLEHPDYIKLQEDFAQIANELDYLKKDYLRQKELFEQGATSGKQYQMAKSKYFTAKAKYEGLRQRLKMLSINPDDVLKGKITSTIKIHSPINGVVTAININVGTYAEPGKTLFVIKNNDSIMADFLVYEKDFHKIKIGQKVNFNVSNRTNGELTGRIFAIEKQFEPDVRAVKIHATIEGNKQGLIPGMFITGQINTDSVDTRALPADAVGREGDKYYIFIVDNNALKEALKNKAIAEKFKGYSKLYAFRMVEVAKGAEDNGYVEIRLLKTLPDTAKVVVKGAYYLLSDLKKSEEE